MPSDIAGPVPAKSTSNWLPTYYFTRAAFAAGWVALAFTLARSDALLASILLILYPAWDALANAIDARRNGGLGHNKTQTINLIVSANTVVAVALALGSSMNDVLDVSGAWAVLAGILQLATGVRRWKS